MSTAQLNDLKLNHMFIDQKSVFMAIDSEEDPLIKEVLEFLLLWFGPDEYIVQQTSGSTGIPKPIRISKKNMLHSAAMTNSFFGLKKDSVALLCLSPQYIAGKMMVVRALLGGFNLITTSLHANPLAKLTEKVDFAAMVPLQVSETLNKNPEKMNFIGSLIIGGSPLDQKTEQMLQHVTTSCWHTYGMTETISHIALRKLNGHDKSIWFSPLEGISISIDERQCLVVDAPTLSNELIITNDLVRMDTSGRFQIIGRADDVIIHAGHKIHPAVVEQKIAHLIPYPFVLVSKQGSAGEEPILLIQHEYHVRELFLLWQQVSRELASYELPRSIEFIEQIPMLPSGKTDRQKLKVAHGSASENSDKVS